MRVAAARNEQHPFTLGWAPYRFAEGERRAPETPLHLGEPAPHSLVCSELGGPFTVERRTLPESHGDYTLISPLDDSLLLDVVCIERKGLDLVMSLSTERERIMREMATIGGLSKCPVLLVESPIEDMVRGMRVGNASPKSLLGTVLSILTDHRVMPLFMPSRPWAEYAAAWILRRRWRWWLTQDPRRLSEVRRLGMVAKAQMGEAVPA